MTRVVVGIDGSARSVEALRVADAEARWRNARLEAVLVYAPQPILDDRVTVAAATMWRGTTTSQSSDVAHVLRDGRRRGRERARRHATALLAQRVADAGLDTRAMDCTVVSDARPAHALVRLAAGADLLVLGAPGRVGSRRGLRGSVGRYCVRHVDCPVLLVGGGGLAAHRRPVLRRAPAW